MKINIKNENVTKLQKAISEAEGKARVRTITAEELIAACDKISAYLGIAPGHLKGVKAKIDLNASDFRSTSSAYPSDSTIAVVEHTGREWALVDVSRRFTQPSSRAVRFDLTDEAREWILKRMESMSERNLR